MIVGNNVYCKIKLNDKTIEKTSKISSTAPQWNESFFLWYVK